MTIQEFYTEIGSDADNILKRLSSEGLIKRLVKKFPQDKSFMELKTGLEQKDAERAFLAAHTLKGICLNMEFNSLGKACSELTEKLRGRQLDGTQELFEHAEHEYQKILQAIEQIDS